MRRQSAPTNATPSPLARPHRDAHLRSATRHCHPVERASCADSPRRSLDARSGALCPQPKRSAAIGKHSLTIALHAATVIRVQKRLADRPLRGEPDGAKFALDLIESRARPRDGIWHETVPQPVGTATLIALSGATGIRTGAQIQLLSAPVNPELYASKPGVYSQYQ
jgi:hypothetical protein